MTKKREEKFGVFLHHYEGGRGVAGFLFFSLVVLFFISLISSSLTFHHWRGQQARGATRFGIGISGATGEHRVKGATSLRSRDLTGGVGIFRLQGWYLLLFPFIFIFYLLFSSFSFVEVYLGKIKIRVLFSFILSGYSFIVSWLCESLGGRAWGFYFFLLFAWKR